MFRHFKKIVRQYCKKIGDILSWPRKGREQYSGPPESVNEPHPSTLRGDDSVSDTEDIDELSHIPHNDTLVSEFHEGQLHTDQSSIIGSVMCARPFCPMHDGDSTPTLEIIEGPVVEEPLHMINDHVSPEIVEQRPHIDQSDVPVETNLHILNDKSPILERRTVELPVEVHEHIIAFLDTGNDAGTIANCARVCRRWAPFSRFKLYHIIPLRNRRQWTSFDRLMVPTAPTIMVEYLRDVRELQICPEDARFSDREEKVPLIGWREGQKRPWTHLALLKCAEYLSHLIHIELSAIDLSEHYYKTALRSGSSYHSVTTLSLRRCKFTNIGRLHIFVTAFPRVADLTLDDTQLRLWNPSPIPTGGHSITRLTLVGGTDDVMAAVARWLAISRLVENLADLNWHGGSEDRWQTLTKDGHSLQRLEFWVDRSWQVDLSRFVSLRALTLRYSSWYLRDHLESLAHILPSISDHLEELHVYLDHSSSDASPLHSTLITFNDLKIIDGLLAGPQFPHLHHVTFECRNLHIYIDDVPDTSPVALGGSIVPIFGQSSNQLVSIPPDSQTVSQYAPERPFRPYVEHLLRRKIQDELKQLVVRGILETKLTVQPEEPTFNMDTGSGARMDTQSWTRTQTSMDSDIASLPSLA